MQHSEIKKEIIDAIKKNHAEQIQKGEQVINTLEGIHALLPHLSPQEINIALGEMNSVKLLDNMPGNLEFFPNLF